MRRVLIVLIVLFIARPASAEPRRNKMVVAGLALAISGYALSTLKPLDCALHGASGLPTPYCDAAPWLLVPLAGHPIYLADSKPERITNHTALHQAVLALDWAPCVMQWAGLALAAVGIARGNNGDKTTWTAAPIVTPSTVGLRAGRSF